MKAKFLALILIGILSICSCETSSNLYNVSGYIYNNGVPAKNASVSLDRFANYMTSTNSEGYFSIKNVTTGTYDLNVQKDFDDGTYTQQTYEVAVNTDLLLESLLLPNPVSIASVELDSLTNMLTLLWNKSHADDFREYKLYSHINSGLDETTGSLEHVTTFRDDTVFNLQLSGSEEVFFRVFVLNDYGQLGGSNIQKVNSINLNLLTGGGFEDYDIFNKYWTITDGTASIIDSVFYSGNSCLFMQNNYFPEEKYMEETLMEVPIHLEKDIEYVLSFWYKINGTAQMNHNTLYFYYRQQQENRIETNLSFELGSNFWSGKWIPQGPFKILDDTEWLFYSKTFASVSDSPARFFIGGRIENIMLDNIELKIKEY